MRLSIITFFGVSMKKSILNTIFSVCLVMMLSSCYSLTYNVGQGAQAGVSVSAKNHFLIGGLVAVGTSNPTMMAGGAKDYTVNIQHSFIDGLLSGLTGGLYTPTTLSIMGFVQGYRYIFDFNTLTMYGKGYVTGTIVLLILGVALIIAGFFIRKKR